MERKNPDLFPRILLLLPLDAKAFPYELNMLFNLIPFDHEITTLIDEGTALNIVHLELRKAFDMVFHKILMEKLME